MPDVSVIIPCFNHGHYIHDAIDSVLNQTFQNFEIIVVNDGSTDPQTNEILKKIQHPKIKVLHTSNQGLASARNNGIREAQAPIILPLDSDDKIDSSYLRKACDTMKERYDIGIVTCNASFFGAKAGNWILHDYSEKKILFENVIFSASFFWRHDWEKVKGYNPNMTSGWEDWDFWLSIISLNRAVFRIPECLFRYRIHSKSMVHRMSDSDKAAMHARLFLNHEDYFKQHLEAFFDELHHLQNTCNRSLIDRFINDKFMHPFQTINNLLHRSNSTP
jgi:glycosyltransferase involved in cell wall biosynthesis